MSFVLHTFHLVLQMRIKNRKDSMSFQIERSDGLSENLTGILGETMQGEWLNTYAKV